MPVAPRLTIIAAAVTALALPAGASAKKAHGARVLPAKWEHRFHVTSPKTDPDGDGLNNWTEFRAKTSPRRVDSDRDGISDDAEDRDRDGLDNATEQRTGTDPAKRDSDHDRVGDAREDADRDGLPNGAEQATANDPVAPDSDDDGIKDGAENAGQVVAFADGVLTLRLAATGKLVTAPVADDASVDCGATDDYEADFEDDVADDPSPAADDDADGSDVADDQSDDGADDPSDDRSEDDVVAAAAVIRGEDDGYSADDAADAEDELDLGTDDATCVEDALAPGAWVHEAQLADDGDGPRFASVALVEDE